MIVLETKALRNYLQELTMKRLKVERITIALFDMIDSYYRPDSLYELDKSFEMQKLQDKTVEDSARDNYLHVMTILEGLRKRGIDPEEALNLLDIWRNAKVFSPDDFADDPYYKNIKFDKPVTDGDFTIRRLRHYPYELFCYDTSELHPELFIDIPRIGSFDKRFDYYGIRQDSKNFTWMSITPSEMITMKKGIEDVTGRVLALGLGMGYFAYMAALKPEVERIDVIEISPDVIRLFESHIRPQFPKEIGDKINIIEADAINYITAINDSMYDFCYADIWQGPFETDTFMRVREIMKRYPGIKTEYWIETAYLRRLQQYIIIDMMSTMMPGADLGYLLQYSNNRECRYISALYEDITISKPEDLASVIADDFLLERMDSSDVAY